MLRSKEEFVKEKRGKGKHFPPGKETSRGRRGSQVVAGASRAGWGQVSGAPRPRLTREAGRNHPANSGRRVVVVVVVVVAAASPAETARDRLIIFHARGPTPLFHPPPGIPPAPPSTTPGSSRPSSPSSSPRIGPPTRGSGPGRVALVPSSRRLPSPAGFAAPFLAFFSQQGASFADWSSQWEAVRGRHVVMRKKSLISKVEMCIL